MAAATFPAGFTHSTIATGLAFPTAMEIAPDGRNFVAQPGGAQRVLKTTAANEPGFKIERCTNSGCGTFVKVGTVGAKCETTLVLRQRLHLRKRGRIRRQP